MNCACYEVLFGQQYHPVLHCTVTEMHNCVSIVQHLKLSPNEQLVKYVKDNDIIVIDNYDSGAGLDAHIIKEDTDDVDDMNESEEGLDINIDTFPDCQSD